MTMVDMMRCILGLILWYFDFLLQPSGFTTVLFPGFSEWGTGLVVGCGCGVYRLLSGGWRGVVFLLQLWGRPGVYCSLVGCGFRTGVSTGF